MTLKIISDWRASAVSIKLLVYNTVLSISYEHSLLLHDDIYDFVAIHEAFYQLYKKTIILPTATTWKWWHDALLAKSSFEVCSNDLKLSQDMCFPIDQHIYVLHNSVCLMLPVAYFTAVPNKMLKCTTHKLAGRFEKPYVSIHQA